MAPPAAFIAVQCCECSTMQVKQEKKISNKWSCVICRQRQSVRTVFARSGLARDVRQVVQHLNMSRGSADLAPPAVEVRLPEGPPKRTDWSEYLEDLGDQKESLGDDCEGDVEVTTELPAGHQVFGKMRERSKANSNASDLISSNSKILKPTFTKRKASSSYPQGEGTVDAKRSKRPPSGAASASKWSCYLEGDKSLIESGAWGEDDLLQNGLEGEQVEEDVHPDFM